MAVRAAPTQILVIEDDPAVAAGLRDGLAREGYVVMLADGGAAGIRQAQGGNPQLIILDVRLPDGSGFDFCRQMRRAGLRQPILMLTVQRDELDKVLGLEMGADDYLTKPYSLRELLARVRALLRRAYGELSSAGGDVLYAGELVIDLGRGQVSRTGHPGKNPQAIALTPTEFKLLVHLARHRGQALTRQQLLDAVWGYDADPESERMVNVHIRRLREKVESEPSQPSLILTVPGIGYRLAG